jgi:hypothetical protein
MTAFLQNRWPEFLAALAVAMAGIVFAVYAA